MKWDSSRPVPWKRLCIEWTVVAGIVAIVSLLVTENRTANSYFALAFGGVIYLAVGALMAKLGYQRKTLQQVRADVAAAPPRTVGGSRPRPAPTKRTAGGNQHRQPKRRK